MGPREPGAQALSRAGRRQADEADGDEEGGHVAAIQALPAAPAASTHRLLALWG